MVFWQLTINANDPIMLSRFWAEALGYQTVPAEEPNTPWQAHYRTQLADGEEFDNRLFDPAGMRPPIFFQRVPEGNPGNNRIHLDLYPTERDDSLPRDRRIEVVEAKVGKVVALGATVQRRTREDDPEDPTYFVVMRDPEGNEFCIS